MAETRTSGTGTRPSWLWLLAGGGILAAGIGIFLAASAAGAASRTGEASEPRSEAPLVEVAEIRAAPVDFIVRAPGRLQPRQELVLVGEVAGKVAQLSDKLEVGGRFAPGELIFRIEQDDYSARVAEAEAALSTARANLQRAEADAARQAELAERGFAPQSVVDTTVAALADARAAVERAEAQLALARSNLARTEVRAPFPALVLSERLSPGSYVAPGAELARLIDASAGELEAGLSPQDVDAVRQAIAAAGEAGIEVRAVPNESSLGTLTLEGRLDAFAPAIDPASRTVAVVAVFPDAFRPEHDGKVFAGDFMTLEIAGRSTRPLYEVPVSAVRRSRHLWLVARDNRLEDIIVEPVEQRGDTMLVAAEQDLAGMRVMLTPLAEEVEDMQVRVEDAGAP